MNKHLKHFLIKFLKILGWIIGSVIFLLLLIVLAVRIPFVQDIIKDKAISFFKNKTNTEASIGSLYINFPSGVEVNQLYIEDLQGDTLVYAGQISVDANLLDLLNNELALDDIYAENLYAHIYNTESDSTFNYQFIIDSFTAPDTTSAPQDTTAAPFRFGVYGVEVDGARILYDDAFNGMLMGATVGYLAAEASEFDLINSNIFVESIHLENSDGYFRITKETMDQEDPPSAPFYINGRKLFVSSVDFTFEDEPGGIRVINSIGQANITADSINIVDQIYDAESITLLDSHVFVYIFDTGNTETDSTESDTGDFSLLASSDNITLGELDIRFYDHSEPMISDSFDPAHIWVQSIDLQANDMVFRNGEVQGDISRMDFTEMHGFTLLEFNTSFAFTDTEAYMRSLVLRTGDSKIMGDFVAEYPSLSTLANSPEQLVLSVDIQTSDIAFNDITYFLPDIRETLPITVPPGTSVKLDGHVEGSLADLSFENVDIRTLGQTRLSTTGRIQGLPDINKMRVSIPSINFTTTRENIITIVPDTLIPPSLTIPEQISLEGQFNGSLSDFTTDMLLNTTMGSLMAKGEMSLDDDSIYHYNAHIVTDSLALGTLINNPDLGMTAFNFDVEGAGFDPEQMQATFNGAVSTLYYKHYPYDSIYIDGSIDEGVFEGEVDLDDPNLAIDFDGTVGFLDSVNHYSFTLDIPRADIRALNFAEGEFQLVGNVKSDLSGSSVDNLNGYIKITDTFINRRDRILSIDSLYFQASADRDSTAYHLFSDFIDVDFEGTFQISLLPTVIQQHFSKYFELDESDTIELTELRDQAFAFNVDIKDPRFFTYIVPGLTQLRPGEISGEYNSSEWRIDLIANLYELDYSGIMTDSILIEMNSDEYQLTYNVSAATIDVGPLAIKNMLLNGDVESDRIMANLHILDEEGEDRYLFGGIFISLEDYYRFMFTPGKVITNYHEWDIKPSNAINFYENDVWIQNLAAEYNDQFLRFNSNVNERGDSVQTLVLENFNLGQLGRITRDSLPLLSGTIDGETVFNSVSGGLAFTSDMIINNFSFKGDTLGTIDLNANTENGVLYDVNVGINGRQNDILLTGNYRADSIATLDMQLDINRLQLNTIQSFTAGMVDSLQGYIEGDISLTGTTVTPDVDGRIRFQNVSITPSFLGAPFKIDNQLIRLNNTGLRFDDFVIRDKDNDPARISGTITTEDLLVYNLDIQAEMEKFLLLDRPLPDVIRTVDNPLFGQLDVTSSITIRGTSLQPKINLSARFADGSTFAYIIPEATLSEQEQKDVVEWFDQDVENIEFFSLSENQGKDSVQRALEGIDLSANITVTPQNELSIVIDPITGDRLTVRGEANLNYDIRPSGNQVLTGRYEVSSGAYNLNFYDLIKREFQIQEGSYILWTGDPLNAIMNVTAINEVRASPPVPGAPGKLDFLVYLDIGGQLLQPEISFRLGLAPDAQAPIAVESWVAQQNSQEERVNKQVFGLLLFQTFFPDESYAGTASTNLAASTARNSVSSLLSSQLSKLSNQIEGIDLSIDIDSYEDYSASGDTYGRTELELGVSKELFDERVVVKLAGNVDLEGNRSQQGVSDFAGDIQIEYKLTEDGRFRLLGFRNNDFDNLQGEIIRTGVGIIYVREYNAFKELFKKSEEEKGGSDE